MKKILMTTIAALSLMAGASGQVRRATVSGYIRENATGETLIGAGVVDTRQSVAAGAVTNDYGFYTLTVPVGKTVLSYSYVGCKTESISIDLVRDTVLNISLAEADILDAATVVARKDAGIQST